MITAELLNLIGSGLRGILDGSGLRRADLEDEEWRCVVYFVGENIRIDLRPKQVGAHPARRLV